MAKRPTSAAIRGVLTNAFRTMWTIPPATRAAVLGRIATHSRQFEGWWKFELATALWDFAPSLGDNVYVYVEAFGRADVVLASSVSSEGKVGIADGASVKIPIELKTVGTFWGSSSSSVRKAYTEPGKKRLVDDIVACATQRRDARPFACVALLVTHVGAPDDAAMQRYLDFPRQLAKTHGLDVILDEPVPIPPTGYKPVCAHQFLWVR